MVGTAIDMDYAYLDPLYAHLSKVGRAYREKWLMWTP
jgi:hypothetical protein